MAISTVTKQHAAENNYSNLMGIPAHDYIANVYDGQNLSYTTYRLGGPSGDVVGIVTMTYDGNNNLLTAQRIQ
jgi:hypothetical protein